MTTHYGSEGTGALNKLHLHYGNQVQPISNTDRALNGTDCISCQRHRLNKLPINPTTSKPYNLCVQICQPILDKVPKYMVELADYTRAQLIIKFPNIGLHIRQDKDTMLRIIALYLKSIAP